MGRWCGEKTGTVSSIIKQYITIVWRDYVKTTSLPKTVKLKLFWFIALVFLCVLTMVLICLQSCSVSCSGLCNISGLKPVINNLYHYNHSKIHFSHTKRYLPKCIVIGVRKAGTRALLKYLDIHPEIVTAPDEMHFFDDDEEYSKGLDYYRKNMPYSFEDQITIEKTPSYFTEPLVPERIYRMNDSVLLLLIVRDPVTRLLSDYSQFREKLHKKGKEIAPFESVVLDSDGNVHTNYKPIQTSVYSIHLARWLEFFQFRQIHIVDGDLLIENPYKEMHDIETFLGLEHRITEDKFYFNATKGFFCVNDEQLSSCLGETKGRPHPRVESKVLLKLRKFYRKRNEVFFKLVNRTFNWL